jgi:glucarate dehydratase
VTGTAIQAIDVWTVNVPLRTSFASSFETKAGTTRTVLRVRTSEGAEGWGETMHGRPTAALVERLRDEFLGMDGRATAEVARRTAMVPFFHGYLGYCAVAGLEMALWDLAGRTSGRPLSLLLGGGTLDAIPVTGLLTRGDAGAGLAAADLPRALGEAGARIVSEGGFGALKLKGSPDDAFDVAVMGELRRALPGVALRVDPNAAWSVPAALRAARELEPLGLEYLEDPCSGLEGMARVRAATRTPLCTNMCVVRLEELAPAVRMGAVDVVHADVHKWGGIHATVAMRAVCLAFGLGVNLHSGGELGLSTACHLQVASALGLGDFAADSMYPLLADDVVTEPIGLREGALAVPCGPGLGVEVDLDKLRHYAGRNAEEGDHTL